MDFDIRQYYDIVGTGLTLILLPTMIALFIWRWSNRIQDSFENKDDNSKN